MKKILEKIKDRDDHQKRLIALVGALVVTGIVGTLILSFRSLETPNQAAKVEAQKQAASVVDSLGQDVKVLFNNQDN
jgi:hypothetical protein